MGVDVGSPRKHTKMDVASPEQYYVTKPKEHVEATNHREHVEIDVALPREGVEVEVAKCREMEEASSTKNGEVLAVDVSKSSERNITNGCKEKRKGFVFNLAPVVNKHDFVYSEFDSFSPTIDFGLLDGRVTNTPFKIPEVIMEDKTNGEDLRNNEDKITTRMKNSNTDGMEINR